MRVAIENRTKKGRSTMEVCQYCTEVTIRDVDVLVFDSFEELAPMREEWDEFVESLGGEIFLTYDWCRVWWKYYGQNRDLRVFIFRQDNDLVGLVPLFIEKIYLGPVFVKAVKLVGSDFTKAQFSLPITTDHIKCVMKKLLGILNEDRPDVVHIGPIAGLYNHYEKLLESLSGPLDGFYDTWSGEKMAHHTYFLLAGTWEEQLAGLSRNERKKIKRRCKALAKILQNEHEDLISSFAAIENVDDMFDNFVNMHRQHWQKLGKSGHFGDWPDAFEFHKEMAKTQLEHNRLRLMMSRCGRQCLGYEYAYRFGDKYFAFLNARTDYNELSNLNIGTILFAEQVKKAINENVRYIDDMPGRYQYKVELGCKLFPVRDIYVFNKKFIPWVRVLLFRVFSTVLNLCYYKIWFIKIAPRLSMNRGKLWKIWIRSNMFAYK
jgi:CelD/BcsL family acetyltransferase involved in cellulose biosynthesis